MELLKKKPKIRTVLLTVNLAVLLLPLAGIWGFRLYETELIRRTEAELIAQSVLIKELFLKEFDRRHLSDDEKSLLLGDYIRLKFRDRNRIRIGEFRKIYPRLDIYRENKRDPIIAPEESAPLENAILAGIGEELEPILRNAQFNLLSGIRVTDAHGVVIASTTSVTGQNISDREEVRRALAGEPLSIIRRRAQRNLPTHSVLSYGTGVIVFVAQPVIYRERILGSVIASRTPVNLANAIYEHRYHLIRFATLLMVLVLLVTVLTASTIGGPIRRLAKQIGPAYKGRPGRIIPLKNPGTEEVKILSEAFVAMSNSMHERADYTEGLVRSISHEFKTPIASINAAVEILDDHLDTMSADERKKFLSMINKDAHRLTKLVDRLLELARADAIMNPTGSCHLLPVLNEVREYFAGQYGTVTIDVEKGLDQTTVQIPRENLYICLSNLVQNSITHGGTGVGIEIRLSRCADGTVLLSIADNGPGIVEHDRSKIFDPFFTTARAHGGTGLGLAIVKSLAETYGGSIALVPTKEGTRFDLILRRV